MFCKSCGEKIKEGQLFCTKCGTAVDKDNESVFVEVLDINQETKVKIEPKSKVLAGLLGILLGYLGIHNFYLGFKDKGLTQLLLSTIGILAFGLGPIISGIWGLVEGIMIFMGTIDKDADGVLLKEGF